MNDENRLNPGHRKLRQVLRLVGPLVMGVGVIFAAIGLISFFSSFGSFGPPRYFWCAFVGLPLIALGSAITKFAFMGSVLRYMSAESSPVGKDTFNYMAEGTQSGVRTMARAVREGFLPEATACPHCGHGNDADAKFCDECGQPMSQEITCPQCSTVNRLGARFCNGCGHQLAGG